MKKYLISLDVDGTMLDTNYRSTSPTINSVIEQLTREGHCFILNSNRSLEDLLTITKQFDIEGPVIGENGCFVYDQISGEQEIFVSNETVEKLMDVKKFAQYIISERFPEAHFTICDTTDVNKHLDVQNVPAGKKYVFFMNEFRKYTLSIHVKRIENGLFIKDTEKVNEYAQFVEKYIKDKNYPFKTEYTTSFANLLVYPTEVNKAYAYEKLVVKYPNYLRIVIGDDYLDKPLRSETDYFFVVGNADDDVKQVADYIAREKITKGVEEILLKIDELIK